MKPDTAEKPVDIGRVIDMALLYNPMMAIADLSTIRMWVNEGCDIDLDIMPVMERIMKYKKGVNVFRYFTNPILESRDRRRIQEKQIEQATKQPDEYYIKIFKWKKAKGLILSAEQESMLTKYESTLATLS